MIRSVGRRMMAGGCGRLGLLGVVVWLASVAGPPVVAQEPAPLPTAPITIEGVTLRQVLDAPVPLYVTASVPDQKVRWMRDAVAIALEEVPRLTGLPLPTTRLEFYLFTDPAELSMLAGQILRSPGPRLAPECFALTQSATPRRGIYCQADTWESAAEALDYVVHEVTHQVEQGDTPQRRGLAQWYNEGLAEYVQQRVLAEYAPAYAARDRWQREGRVASALHTGRLLRLRDLSTNARWQQAAGSGWAGQIYSHSSLVIGYLADSYGLPAVVEVVRRTGHPFDFETAFEEVFGVSVAAAERAAAEALAADLLPRYPVGLHVYPDPEAPGHVLHLAVVGFQPREWLEKEYRYENGAEAVGRPLDGAHPEPARTDAAGFASWAWEGEAPPPGLPPRVRLTVHGSSGSEASQVASLAPAP